MNLISSTSVFAVCADCFNEWQQLTTGGKVEGSREVEVLPHCQRASHNIILRKGRGRGKKRGGEEEERGGEEEGGGEEDGGGEEEGGGGGEGQEGQR